MKIFPTLSFVISSKRDLDDFYRLIDSVLCESSRLKVYFLRDRTLFTGNRRDNIVDVRLIGGVMHGKIYSIGEEIKLHVVITSRCVACLTLFVSAIMLDISFTVYFINVTGEAPNLKGLLYMFLPSMICYIIILINLWQTAKRIKQQFHDLLQ